MKINQLSLLCAGALALTGCSTAPKTFSGKPGVDAVKRYLNSIGRIESAETVKEEGKELQVYRIRIAPTPQSCIRIGIALPRPELWTGRLVGLGNCGFPTEYDPKFYNWKPFNDQIGCTINLVSDNNAVVTTDMGFSRHRIKNPEVWKDFGFRSTHLMTVIAKEVIQRYYGKAPHHSYFIGLSTGGGQALHEAQKFPEDYDGILGFVPANCRMGLLGYSMAFYRATHDEKGKQLFTKNQMGVIGKAAAKYFAGKAPAYAAGKFVPDSRYTPEAAAGIARIASELDPSITPELQKRVARFFTDAVIGNKKASGGVPLGAADLWKIFDGRLSMAELYYGRDFDMAKYNEAAEFPKMAQEMGLYFNAENPDLSLFRDKGGKMIILSGSEDCIVPFSGPMAYYERAAKAAGGMEKLKEFFLYYILPGRDHNRGRGIRHLRGIDKELIAWCEQGKKPGVQKGYTAEGKCYAMNPYPELPAGNGSKTAPMKALPLVQPDPVFTRSLSAKEAHEWCNAPAPEIQYPQWKVSNWYGYRKYEFEIDGHKAFIVAPKKAAPGRPWSWCLMWPTAFVPRTPAIKLVEKGYHHVFIDIHKSRMNDEGVKVAEKFYDLLQSLHLNPKGALIGLSIGGLYSLRWAMEHPETVSSIYLDAPVCAFLNAGEVKAKHPGTRRYYERCYNVKGYEALLNSPKSPINGCDKIARAGIPILLLRHGQDQTVDPVTHSDLLTKKFKEAGGRITVINFSFYGHHPHGMDNPYKLVDFILANEF